LPLQASWLATFDTRGIEVQAQPKLFEKLGASFKAIEMDVESDGSEMLSRKGVDRGPS